MKFIKKRLAVNKKSTNVLCNTELGILALHNKKKVLT